MQYSLYRILIEQRFVHFLIVKLQYFNAFLFRATLPECYLCIGEILLIGIMVVNKYMPTPILYRYCILFFFSGWYNLYLIFKFR